MIRLETLEPGAIFLSVRASFLEVDSGFRERCPRVCKHVNGSAGELRFGLSQGIVKSRSRA
jgi:hypothetical protein